MAGDGEHGKRRSTLARSTSTMLFVVGRATGTLVNTECQASPWTARWIKDLLLLPRLPCYRRMRRMHLKAVSVRARPPSGELILWSCSRSPRCGSVLGGLRQMGFHNSIGTPSSRPHKNVPISVTTQVLLLLFLLRLLPVCADQCCGSRSIGLTSVSSRSWTS